jgi:hypothetical protein
VLLRLATLVLVAGLSSGCASFWAVAEVTDLSWSQGEYKEVEPLAPPEKRVRVSAEYEAPPPPPPPALPPVAAEPVTQPPVLEPGPVTIVPAPLVVVSDPRRPLPVGALRLNCLVEKRNPRERVNETKFRYDGTWKALMVFFFISEAAFSTLLISASTKEGEPKVPLLVMGGVLGLDALGTAVLFFHPPEERKRVYEQEGPWNELSSACPSTLEVETPTGSVPVTAQREMTGFGEWLLQETVWSEEAKIALRAGASRNELNPTMSERCRWSDLARSPAPYCKKLWGSLRWSDAPLALPPD